MTEHSELLPFVILGLATPEEVRQVKAALETDVALRREYAELELVLTGLGATEAVEPPASLKQKILAASRGSDQSESRATNEAESRVRPAPTSKRTAPRPMARVLPWVMAGLATALTAVAVFVAFPQSQINATTLAATSDGSIIYANSGAMSRSTPAMLVRSNGAKIPVQFVADKECKFTAAVSSDGLTYLLDQANNTVFIIEESTGKMVDRWLVPANATGLDVVGNTVVVRSSQVALIFRRNQSGEKSMVEARLSSSKPSAYAEAAVIDGERLYTTDQTLGVVHVLETATGKEIKQFEIPEKPVSLAVRNGLWVLDAAGVLLKLELSTGAVLEKIVLEGTPQLLRLTDLYAFVADKEGFVSVVDLQKQQVTVRKRLRNPALALSMMPDGHIAIAVEKNGIVVLDNKLEMVKSIN